VTITRSRTLRRDLPRSKLRRMPLSRSTPPAKRHRFPSVIREHPLIMARKSLTVRRGKSDQNTDNPGPGSTVQYSFTFPTDEPPGLYCITRTFTDWPTRGPLAGLQGPLVVDGNPDRAAAVRGLRQRILVIRDQHKCRERGRTGQLRSWTSLQGISVKHGPH